MFGGVRTQGSGPEDSERNQGIKDYEITERRMDTAHLQNARHPTSRAIQNQPLLKDIIHWTAYGFAFLMIV